MSLSDLTFTNNTVSHDGGAAYAYQNSNLSIDSCIFLNNLANNSGGAVYVRNNCNLTVTNCTLTSNMAQNSGGGVHAQDNSFVYIEGTNFSNNSGDVGAGMRLYVFSTAQVTNSKFSGNVARVAGGAMATYERSMIRIHRCDFLSNTANVGGGLIAFQGNQNGAIEGNSSENDVGTMSKYRQNMINVDESTFSRNSAGNGGAMYVQRSLINVKDSSFSENSARYDGGDIDANIDSVINFNNSEFVSSVAERNGGALSLVGDCDLNIHNCTFIGCRSLVDGGSVQLGQSNAIIMNSTFHSSMSTENGGVVTAQNSTVNVERCSLVNNTAAEKGGAIYSTTGSFFAVANSYFQYNWAVNSSGGALYCSLHSHCRVIESSFEQNIASSRGGAIYTKEMSEVDIIASSFISNGAQRGGALAAREMGAIKMSDANEASQHLVHIHNNTATEGGGIYLSNGFLHFGMKSRFTYNSADTSGGGIYADDSSIISFNASVELVRNTADTGGAINLMNTKLYDEGPTVKNVSFISNKANLGGALFVSDESFEDACFNNLQSELHSLKGGCFFQNITDNFVFNFGDNHANLSGHNLYGGLLDRCGVVDYANQSRLELSGVERFKDLSNITDFSTVTSNPAQVCLCNAKMKPDCEQHTYYIQVKDRDRFSVPVVAVDQINHIAPATILSRFEELSLSQSQRVRRIDAACSKIEYQVSFPNLTTYNLTLFPQGPCGDKGSSTLSVVVNVVSCSCSPGLIPSENTNECSCVCDHRYKPFFERISTCDPKNGTVERQGQFWIKYFNDTTKIDSDPYFIYPYCPYDYCHPPSLSVSVDLSLDNGSDSQCANYRGGLLCGSCLPGYSLSLGSSKCMMCSNGWHGRFVEIFIAFIIAGILLVVSLLVLNITVAVGTFNSIIFFANILNINRSEYFSQPHLTFIPVFVSWLNLDIGFDTCFFDGMDNYIKTWLQLAFPLYIIILVIVIIWISSCSLRFSKLIGKKNPVATLATLILLSYAKLLQIIIASFSFVTLTLPNGQVETRWLRDANVEYRSGKLIVLVIVAILILLVGAVYTGLLFSWQWLLQLSELKIFAWTKNQKLHTFIETYNTLYTPQHRYWTGLFLIVRVILYLISAFVESIDPRITLVCTITVVLCIIVYKTLWTVTIYKNLLLNLIESFILFNIATFSVITLYTFDDLEEVSKQLLQTVAAYFSVGSVLIICLMIIMYHVCRYGCSKVHSKASNSKVGKRLARNLSYTPNRENSVGFENTLFNAIDGVQFRYGGSHDIPIKPTSSELTLTTHEECNNIQNEHERQQTTTDPKQNRGSLYKTAPQRRSRASDSSSQLRRKTEAAASLAHLRLTNEKIKKPLLDSEV